MQDKEREIVCITGGTGFVGRHIAHELCSRGLKVKCVVRPISDLMPLVGLNIETCQGEVTDVTSLEKALQNVGTVVHLVAIIRETKEATFEMINLGGTKNLLHAAKRMGVKKFIYMSNLGAGPDRRFPLLYTKWQAEEEVRNSGIDFVILRPSVIFGRGDGFINVLAGIIKKTPLVPSNQAVLLGGPEYLSYEEIVDLIIDRLKVRRRKAHIPVPLMHLVAWTGEKLGLRLPVTAAQVAMLAKDNITSLDAVEKVFGFKPLSLRERIDNVLH